MPDDKRPRATLDINAGYGNRPALPGGEGASAKTAALSKSRRSAPGFIGVILAGLFGGIVTASGFYLAVKQDILGFSLTDPRIQRQIKELQDRTALLESSARAARPAPAS